MKWLNRCRFLAKSCRRKTFSPSKYSSGLSKLEPWILYFRFQSITQPRIKFINFHLFQWMGQRKSGDAVFVAFKKANHCFFRLFLEVFWNISSACLKPLVFVSSSATGSSISNRRWGHELSAKQPCLHAESQISTWQTVTSQFKRWFKVSPPPFDSNSKPKN